MNYKVWAKQNWWIVLGAVLFILAVLLITTAAIFGEKRELGASHTAGGNPSDSIPRELTESDWQTIEDWEDGL